MYGQWDGVLWGGIFEKLDLGRILRENPKVTRPWNKTRADHKKEMTPYEKFRESKIMVSGEVYEYPVFSLSKSIFGFQAFKINYILK